MTSQQIRLSTNFMTLIQNLTFTDYEWFPWNICNECGMPAGNAYPWTPGSVPPLWDLLVLQLLRPDSSNLPCFYSSFHLEYPLVLSRFCFFSQVIHEVIVLLRLHRVQRLMLSKGAKRWIWGNITWFPNYFWQMTIARSEDINKDDTSILNLFKELLVSANTSVQF